MVVVVVGRGGQRKTQVYPSAPHRFSLAHTRTHALTRTSTRMNKQPLPYPPPPPLTAPLFSPTLAPHSGSSDVVHPRKSRDPRTLARTPDPFTSVKTLKHACDNGNGFVRVQRERGWLRRGRTHRRAPRRSRPAPMYVFETRKNTTTQQFTQTQLCVFTWERGVCHGEGAAHPQTYTQTHKASTTQETLFEGSRREKKEEAGGAEVEREGREGGGGGGTRRHRTRLAE